jgi:NTE family protein
MDAEVVIAVNLNRNDVTGGLAQSSNNDPINAAGYTGAVEHDESEEHPVRTPNEASKSRKESFLKNLSDRYQSLQETLQDKVNRWFPEEDQGPNIFDVIGTSLNVMEQQVTRSRLKAHAPDLLVEPHLNDFAVFDFHQASHVIRRGHHAMKEQLPSLMELL